MEAKKHRRSRGTGSVYQVGKVWWVAYRAADGTRVKESSRSERKGDGVALLEKRNGSRIHKIPIVKNQEQIIFYKAAQDAIDHCEVHHPKSHKKFKGRIERHLIPYFGRHRLAGITSTDVTEYTLFRKKEGIIAHKGKDKGKRIGDVSNAEINRELQTLKRIFNLAIKQHRIAMRPTVELLPESAARSGFFERAQFDAVMMHLPIEIRSVIAFAYHTGWRVHDEVLPLEWRNVDFAAGEVRLDPGTTKNQAGRLIEMSAAVRQVLQAQHTAHEALKKAGHITPYVFWRMVAKGRGGDKKPRLIKAFTKAWKRATRLAGCPGRIPHDLRRTAARNFIRAGISQSVAMEMTGHKTPSVFDRYNITSSNDRREAVAKYDAADAVDAAEAAAVGR